MPRRETRQRPPLASLRRAAAPAKMVMTAAAVGFGIYLVGFIASFWLPEPPVETAPDETAAAKVPAA